ncbi:MAG: hypothetical protein IPN20_25765 [Haliscomenobacter sp.]|nr:hypothetical protein [Haliscomenobacter sp.]
MSVATLYHRQQQMQMMMGQALVLRDPARGWERAASVLMLHGRYRFALHSGLWTPSIPSVLSVQKFRAMIALHAQHKYYLYGQPTDMRKSFDGLSGWCAIHPFGATHQRGSVVF